MEFSGITRRRLLVSAGSGVLGLAVVGCSSPTPSTAPSAPAPTPSGSPAGPGGGDPLGGWNRVDLDFVSVYILVRGAEAAVVDLGVSDSAPDIEAGLKAAGLNWGSVRHILLTHKHADHAGSLPAVAPLVSAASIYTGAADVAALSNAQVKPLADGAEVFGLRVIGTPGHTAGHISIFDPSTGVLVAGDALRAESGLQGPSPTYTEDLARAHLSVRALAELPVRTILPGHGGPVTEDAAGQLRRLADSLG
jgi:glyoxylase-like metal-dependent hydrolase (beta-lactamase superfamily II)